MLGPFGYVGLAAFFVALGLFVRWAAARRRLMEEARLEYEERVETKPKTIKGVDGPSFEQLYVGAHEPRWALYAAGALIAAIAVTPPAFIGLVQLWPILIMPLEQGRWYDPGFYPWMFYMFFGICAIWAGCAGVAARLHHERAPEPFNAALARARGEPLENIIIPRKRPAWAKKVRPNPKKDGSS
jgi:hypothetical protein